MNKFCHKCGERLVEDMEVEPAFDVCTGEKEVSLVCPSGKCGHYGINHIYKYPSVFAAIFGANIVRCVRPGCNHTHEMYEGI